MGQVDTGGGKGRKTSIELNLVPFIDLMSVLITFLLITAVWTQVSMIQMGASTLGKKFNAQPSTPPPPGAEIVLRLDVKTTGYVLTVNTQVIPIPTLAEKQFDEPALQQRLEQVRQTYPQKEDAILQVADELPYDRLIVTMDLILKTGFKTIAFATGAP